MVCMCSRWVSGVESGQPIRIVVAPASLVVTKGVGSVWIGRILQVSPDSCIGCTKQWDDTFGRFGLTKRYLHDKTEINELCENVELDNLPGMTYRMRIESTHFEEKQEEKG